MRRTIAVLRQCRRRRARCDPDWVTPSVTMLEFVAAGITIERLGGYERLASEAATDDKARWLISGFSPSDWEFVQRLVDETLELMRRNR